jgi:hypothetical protein
MQGNCQGWNVNKLIFLFLVVQYDFDDSVDDKNEALNVRKVLKKLHDLELWAHVLGKYVCPWCWMKLKDGLKVSLLQHAITLSAGNKIQSERANHKALARYLISA